MSIYEWKYWLLFAIIGLLLWGLSAVSFDKFRRGNNSETLVSFPIFLLFLATLVRAFWAIHFAHAPFEGGTHFLIYSLPITLPLAMFILGSWDDHKNLGGRTKLCWIITLWFAATIIHFPFHEWNITSSLLIVTMIYLLSGIIINIALPLLDGINGLFIIYSAITVLLVLFSGDYIHREPYDYCGNLVKLNDNDCYWTTSANYPTMLLDPVISIFLFAFLPLNLLRRKTRLGEAAVLSISSYLALGVADYSLDLFNYWDIGRNVQFIPFLIIFFGVPLLDFFLVLILRMKNGRSPFLAGNDHIHHRLMQSGWSSRKTMLMMILPILLLFSFIQIVKYLPNHWTSNESAELAIDLSGLMILAGNLVITGYLFWRGYTKVNPYQSGAVERGRP